MTAAAPDRPVASDPVVVVGAGPVGLCAAWVLAREGVPVTVLEAASASLTDWRASTFHAATMELLDTVGLAEEMLAEGLEVPRYQYRDRRTGVVAEFDMTSLRDVTRFPFRLQLNQQRLVAMLHRRLAELSNVQMLFDHRVVGASSDKAGATLEVQTPAGSTHVHAPYVLGADGAASGVRKALDIPFEGMTYSQRYLIISVEEDLREDCVRDLADVCYISDPKEFVFILRTPESWRILFPIPEDESAEDALAPDGMQSRLRAFHDLGQPYRIIDCQIYNVHQRVADTFRRGRIMLVGDAAHINSPMGGMGLNSGLHDAFDISRRLLRLLRGHGDVDVELDAYARKRHHVAVEYVRADTHRNTEIMSERDPDIRAAHQDALRATAADPVAARAWMMRASLLAPVQEQGIGTAPIPSALDPSPTNEEHPCSSPHTTTTGSASSARTRLPT